MPYYPEYISFLIFSICFVVCLVYLVFEKKYCKVENITEKKYWVLKLGNIGRSMCDYIWVIEDSFFLICNIFKLYGIFSYLKYPW